jgi:replicative DNA helicase
MPESYLQSPLLGMHEARTVAKLSSSQSEQFVLGALLTKPRLIEAIPSNFSRDHFAFQEHREVFDAILAIGATEESSFFPVCHALAITDREKRAWITGILGASLAPNRMVIQEHCGIVTDMYRRRQIALLAEQMREAAFGTSGLTTDATIAMAMGGLEAVTVNAAEQRGPVLIGDAAEAAVEAGSKFAKGERTALSTGFATIDRALGGMEAGGVYILAGRPGMGKSALGMQMAVEAARANNGVCVISLEMQAAQLGRRALAVESGIPQFILKEGRWDQRQSDALYKAQQRLKKMPLSIEDQGGLNTQIIALKAKAAQRRHGLKLLVVDHLHIVATPNETTRMGATWAVGQVSNALKRIAKEFQIPVLALAQLNRGVEGRDDKRPTMADLRQSGEIEQDAEAIMLLYRAEYYLGKAPPEQGERQSAQAYESIRNQWFDAKERLAGKAELIFEKVRDGEPCSVPLTFDGARTCFREVSNG